MIESICSFILMVVELLAAEYIFALLLERKPFFWARFGGAAAICVMAAFWIEVIYCLVTNSEISYEGTDRLTDSVFKTVYYLVIFAMTIAAVRYCYNGSIWAVLFYCSGGYAMQHIARNLFALIKIIPKVDAVLTQTVWLSFLTEAIVCAVLYAAVYFLLIRRREPLDEKKDVRRKVLLFLCIIFICIGLSRFTTDDPDRSTLAYVAESIGAILNCFFILVILFDLADKDKARRDVVVMEELMRREKDYYKMRKENIELINIKCHDLKHQIQALRENASEPYVRKIEDAIMFYDSVAKTGNDVLDVILTEKSLLCEQNKIIFTCVARGEDLSFMDSMDIYSLFGNAISNAFEKVSLIREEDRRCISVNVRTEDKILSVHIENFYDGEIEFENGFPVTTKNKDYHGFGIKSMNYIAKRYNGCMSVSADDGLFSLDFLFPLSAKQ